MSKRKFYKTTFKFVVLSESPTEGWTIADMIEACDSGPCVGDTEECETVVLTGKEMADALYTARSEPGFFELDDDGEDASGE
jgi:hypothetical protein